MTLTFLTAANGKSLSKHYNRDKSFTPYPLVKKFNSNELPISKKGIFDLQKILNDAGNKGQCLLKGSLSQPLVNESRAGKTDRTALTQLLVLDIDGIELPKLPMFGKKLIAKNVEDIAEQLINELPNDLRNVSYVAQASASFGFKTDKVSLHIFMYLNKPYRSKILKNWLEHINFTVPLFKEQITLSVTGQSLCLPLDISVADNTKVIFIAPPTFEDNTLDPFKSAKDRMVTVKKKNDVLDLENQVLGINPETLFQQQQKLKNELRKSNNLDKREAKLTTVNISKQPKEILTNPDKMNIEIANESYQPFINCNVNGGDSGAYYFTLDNPKYMHNFKGEPIWEIEKADKDFYLDIFDKYKKQLEVAKKPMQAVVMRDHMTKTYYNGLYDANLKQFDKTFPLMPTEKSQIGDFMQSHGSIAPEFIPNGQIEFDPTVSLPEVNITKVPFYINTFSKPKLMRDAREPAESLAFGEAIKIKDTCPSIHTLIDHALGNGVEEFERFINWLSYIFQTRKKTGTAWLLHGVEGTGKGQFYQKVLWPLFSQQYVPMITLQNYEEQYNGYLAEALFCIVDEFQVGDGRAGTMKLVDKLKSNITEPVAQIRRMRTDLQILPSYTNYIFLSNSIDALKLTTGDRRFNIAPRQEKKLIEAIPNISELLKKVKTEVATFANILHTFSWEERFIEVTIDNAAKEQMRLVSMSVIEEFFDAIKRGDLTHFVELLDININDIQFAGKIQTAQKLVKNWIADAKKYKLSHVKMEEIRLVFHVQTEQQPQINQQDFKKRAKRQNIDTVKRRAPGAGSQASPIWGVPIDWEINQADLDEIIKERLSEDDQQKLAVA
jgi:hypothetical protein